MTAMSRWSVMALVVAMSCTHAAPAPTHAPSPPRVVVAPPPPLPPPPLDRDPPRFVDQLLELFDAVAAAMTGPCDEVTAKLGALADHYAEVIAVSSKLATEGRTGELRKAVDARRDKLVAAGHAIMAAPALASCGRDPAFVAALDKVIRP